MTSNAEFIAILIVAAILFIILVLVCCCCWRSINILAAEHGTDKREAFANHLQSSFRRSIRHMESFRQSLSERRHRNRQNNRFSDRATVISESNSSCSSPPQYINSLFFQTQTSHQSASETSSPQQKHPSIPNGNGTVSNGVMMSVGDLNAQYLDENHGMPVMLDPRYQPRSIRKNGLVSDHTHKNSNNSNISPNTTNQRPTPIGRSLTLLTQDELPAVKQPAFVSGQPTAQLHNRYSGYQSDASFTNASNHNHTADITNSSANNTKSSIQDSPSHKVSPYQKYYNERFGLPPEYTGELSQNHAYKGPHSPTNLCRSLPNGHLSSNGSTNLEQRHPSEHMTPNGPTSHVSPRSATQNYNKYRENTTQAVADVFTFETPPKLHSTPEPLLKQPHNYRLPQSEPQRSTQRAVENFRPIQPASSAFVLPLHPHSAFKLTNSNAQQVSDFNKSPRRPGGAPHSPVRSRRGAQLSPERARRGAQHSPERARRGAQHSPERSRHGAQHSPERSRHGAQLSPERSRHGAQHSSERARTRSRSRSPQKRGDSHSQLNDHNVSDQLYNERYIGSVRSHKIAKMRRAQSQEQLSNTVSPSVGNHPLMRDLDRSHTLSPRRHRSDVNSYAYPHARTANHNTANQKSYTGVHSVSNNALNRISKQTDRVFRPIQPENHDTSRQALENCAKGTAGKRENHESHYINNTMHIPHKSSQNVEPADKAESSDCEQPPLPPRRYLKTDGDLVNHIKARSEPEKNNNHMKSLHHLSNGIDSNYPDDYQPTPHREKPHLGHPRSRQRLNFSDHQLLGTRNKVAIGGHWNGAYENIPNGVQQGNVHGAVLFNGDYNGGCNGESFI